MVGSCLFSFLRRYTLWKLLSHFFLLLKLLFLIVRFGVILVFKDKTVSEVHHSGFRGLNDWNAEMSLNWSQPSLATFTCNVLQ